MREGSVCQSAQRSGVAVGAEICPLECPTRPFVALALSSDMRIALWLHLLAIVIWVGGMFFAHVALRPAVAGLPPEIRLPLVAATLGTFFRWVAACVAVVVVTGFMMIIAMGGFGRVGLYVHLMSALGLLMTAIFGFVVAVPFGRVRAAVAAGNWPAAGAAMTQLRRLVGINLMLGLVTLTVAILGHGVV